MPTTRSNGHDGPGKIGGCPHPMQDLHHLPQIVIVIILIEILMIMMAKVKIDGCPDPMPGLLHQYHFVCPPHHLYHHHHYYYQHFYRTQVYLGSDLWVQVSVSQSCFVDLTDVSLVDEDINSIIANDTDWAIPGNTRPNFRISTKFQNLDQISDS